MGQDVAIERIPQLRAERTTTSSAGQATEDGTRYQADGDASRAGEGANKSSGLTAGQCSVYSARSTADGADGCADFHGVMERSDFR